MKKCFHLTAKFLLENNYEGDIDCFHYVLYKKYNIFGKYLSYKEKCHDNQLRPRHQTLCDVRTDSIVYLFSIHSCKQFVLYDNLFIFVLYIVEVVSFFFLFSFSFFVFW